MKRLKLFFACLLMTVLSIGQVWGAEQLAYTLTPAAGSNNSYAGNCDVEISDITWNVTGNSTLTPWRLGGKSLSGVDRAVYSKTAMSNAITKVELTVGAASGIAVNTLTLIVASNADFSSQIDAVTETFTANSTITFTPTSPATEWASGAYYKFVFNVTVTDTKNNKFVAFSEAKFYAEATKTLTSITISGTPDKVTYEEGELFDPTGLVATGTYDDSSNENITSAVDWAYTPAGELSLGTTSVNVTATQGTIVGNKNVDITVNAHTVTPGEYAIGLNNTFFGVSTGNNGAEQTKTKNDITFVAGCTSTAQNKTYYDAGHVRFYADSYLHISVPSGYRITSIVFTAGGTWNGGISANVGSYVAATKTWSGKAQEVEFSFTAQNRIATATVTYEVDAPEEACETPTFSPAAGEYEEAQNVAISSLTEDATIYYTVDGSDPKTSGTKAQYTAAITVSTNQTIKAYAEKEGLLASEVAEAEYTFVAGPEVILDFTTNDWGFPTEKTVDAYEYSAGGYTITVAGSAGKGYNFDTDHLFFGQNGAYITLPTFDFPVSKVVCVGVASGSGSVSFNLFEGDDAVSTAVTSCKIDQTFEIDAEDQASNKTYTIKLTNANNARFAKIKVYRGVEPTVKKPTISGDENFVTSTEVTITCDTEGAVIYYTTDGSDPKVSGSTTPNPFSLTAGATVKAAAKLGDDWSTVAEKTFTKVTALSTMEDVQAAMPNEGTVNINIIIEDWIVTANKEGQSQVWIANADNTKGILLYQSGHGFATGNKLNGVVLNVGITKFNTAPELTSFTASDVTVTTADAITPNETTIDAITTAIQGTVITLKDLTYSSANSNFSDGVNTIAIDTRLYTPALVNEATYDLTGVVMFASGGAIKLIPRRVEDVVKTSADPLPEVDGLAALKAAELGSYVVTFTDAIVTLVDGNNAFIEEANAGALIYKSGHGFSAGDKLNGKYEVTTATYQGKFEITAIVATTGTKTTDAEIPVTTLTIEQLNDNDVFAANESKRIKIVGVTVTDAVESGDATARTGEISDGINTIALYAGKNGVIAAENANIDVIGYPTYHNTDQQLAVWAQDDITVNQKEDAELAWSRTSDVIVKGASWTAPTLTNPHTVTIASYESDNEDVATVTDGGVIALAGGLGTANITAHFAGDATYDAADAVYTITVNEYVPENTDIITAAKIGVTGTSYDAWEDKTGFGTSSVYAGNSTNGSGTNAGAIQLRYNTAADKQSGIVLTSSNGLVLKGLSVTVKNGSNTLNVYAKNTAYTGYSDLYSSDEEVCGKLIGTVSATGAMTLAAGVSYDDNYQYIGMRSANGALYLTDITITWGEAIPWQEVRTGLEVNRHYTVCLEKNITAIDGATFWNLTYRNEGGTMAYLTEETAPEAGKPYIIQATATTLKVVYGDQSADAPVENGALRGTFDGMDADALAAAGSNIYMLYSNELRPIGTNNHLDGHRAYVLYSVLVPVSGAPQPAPGRRVKGMPMQPQVTTGIDEITNEQSQMTNKVIIDGRLFIIRGEKMYDVTGQLVK